MEISLLRCRSTALILLTFSLALVQTMTGAVPEPKTSTPKADVQLGAVDSIINQSIAEGNIPGGVLLVGHDGQVIYRKAYGYRALEPKREPMTVDTIFDMASLTKVVATATAVMQLVEQGKIRLNDPVAKYLPDFGRTEKRTLRSGSC